MPQSTQTKSRRKRRPRQLSLQSLTHGGIRTGAGRKRNKKRINHQEREFICGKWPLHITMRLREGMPSLRARKAYSLFRKAVIKARAKGLRVLEFGVLGNHFHLIVEVSSNLELTRGMQSLNVSLVKNVKHFDEIRRSLFTDRYHMSRLMTPTQVKRAYVYVFANMAKHFKESKVFNWYCSFAVFANVEKLRQLAPKWDWSRPSLTTQQRTWFETALSPPQSWLARTMVS